MVYIQGCFISQMNSYPCNSGIIEIDGLSAVVLVIISVMIIGRIIGLSCGLALDKYKAGDWKFLGYLIAALAGMPAIVSPVFFLLRYLGGYASGTNKDYPYAFFILTLVGMPVLLFFIYKCFLQFQKNRFIAKLELKNNKFNNPKF